MPRVIIHVSIACCADGIDCCSGCRWERCIYGCGEVSRQKLNIVTGEFAKVRPAKYRKSIHSHAASQTGRCVKYGFGSSKVSAGATKVSLVLHGPPSNEISVGKVLLQLNAPQSSFTCKHFIVGPGFEIGRS